MSALYIAAANAPEIAGLLGPLPDGVTVRTAPDIASFDDALGEIEALVAFPHALSQDLRNRMPRLAWLQTLTAGVDPLAKIDLGEVVVSTMSGVQAPQMAELVFLFMLGFARDIRGILARQAAGEWRPAPQPLLAGAHILIVGVGRIAEGLAARCQAFDMRVTGVSGSRSAAPGFDAIRPTADLAAAAAEADYLVVLAPYSERTHHLVSAEVIAALQPHAVLINVSRGGVVDEAALIDALTDRRIGGAGLDVTSQEPLPADSPLWRLPNVILTPHVGGWSTAFARQITPVIAENAARWFASPRRTLRNQLGASDRS